MANVKAGSTFREVKKVIPNVKKCNLRYYLVEGGTQKEVPGFLQTKPTAETNSRKAETCLISVKVNGKWIAVQDLLGALGGTDFLEPETVLECVQNWDLQVVTGRSGEIPVSISFSMFFSI